MAITSPARTIVLIVAPRRWSTSTAAISDSGIATRLISAVRQSNRNATSTMTTSRQPMSSACVRLSMRPLDEVGRPEDRRVDLDAGQAGLQLVERLLDALASRRACWPTGTSRRSSIRPGPSLMTASPIERLVVVHHVGHVAAARSGVPSPLRVADRHLGQVLRRDDRQDVPDAEPLVGGVDRTRRCRSPPRPRTAAARRPARRRWSP